MSDRTDTDIVKIFLDLARISSPSRHEHLVAEYIKNYLAKYPELTVIEDNTGEAIDGNCGNLLATIVGDGPHLLFDAHMDTVAPCEVVRPQSKDGFIMSDGTSVLGADDKSGIALMLAMIDHLIIGDVPHPTITFLFTACEEQSLMGAKLLEQKYLDPIDYAYVLDGEGPIGTAVIKTPHGCKGTLNVIGKEAHAGVCPEEGINAFVVAAEAVSQLPIGRIDEETTCNIGVAQGGTATNVVMGELGLQFEARSFKPEKLDLIINQVKDVFAEVCQKHGATFEENLCLGTPGYELSDKQPILTAFKKACEKTETIYQGASCGGGSNANVYRMRGIDAVNLSTNMQNIHSVEEMIAIVDLKQMLLLLTQLIKEVSEAEPI